MKTKLQIYAIGLLITLFVGSHIYNTYTINSLKSKISKVYDVQIDSLGKQVQDLQKNKDSLSVEVSKKENVIDSLKIYGIQLAAKRNTNTRYYNEKINNVDRSSNDSLKRFLSDYKYTESTSEGNH